MDPKLELTAVENPWWIVFFARRKQRTLLTLKSSEYHEVVKNFTVEMCLMAL